jgi:hypothetical protein
MKRIIYVLLLSILSIAYNHPATAQRHHVRHAKQVVKKEATV